MSTATAPRVTPEAFLAMPDRDLYELVDGQLVETKMSLASIRIAGLVYRRLDEFCEAHQLGWAWPPETLVRCFPDRAKFRKPDGCFVRLDRIPADWEEDAALEIPPDLVIEVVSPHDTAYEVVRKIHEYLDAGVRLLWVFYPPTKTINVYRADRSLTDLALGDELDGEDVLPGFRCPVASLFPTKPA